MAVTFTISSMDRDITQNGKANVVTTIHWRASETDSDGNSGSSYGSVGVTLGSGAFVAYADITHDKALDWCKAALGSDQVTAVETSIANQITEMKTPTVASGVSW